MIRKKGWQFLLGVVFTGGLASYAAQGLAIDTLTPASLYERSTLNIYSPNTEGWTLVYSNPDMMHFGKSGESGESFDAQVALFPIESVGSDRAFLAFVQQTAAGDTDPSKNTVIESNYTLSSERRYSCVRTHTLMEEGEEPELVETHALYCRHPNLSDLAFAAVFSYSGVGRYASLEAEAEAFINGVTVP